MRGCLARKHTSQPLFKLPCRWRTGGSNLTIFYILGKKINQHQYFNWSIISLTGDKRMKIWRIHYSIIFRCSSLFPWFLFFFIFFYLFFLPLHHGVPQATAIRALPWEFRMSDREGIPYEVFVLFFAEISCRWG